MLCHVFSHIYCTDVVWNVTWSWYSSVPVKLYSGKQWKKKWSQWILHFPNYTNAHQSKTANTLCNTNNWNTSQDTKSNHEQVRLWHDSTIQTPCTATQRPWQTRLPLFVSAAGQHSCRGKIAAHSTTFIITTRCGQNRAWQNLTGCCMRTKCNNFGMADESKT